MVAELLTKGKIDQGKFLLKCIQDNSSYYIASIKAIKKHILFTLN